MNTPLPSFNFRWLTALLFVMLASVFNIQAQPILGARNTALGGGGTAYLSGFESTLWNPANLMIRNKAGNIHFGLGHLGVLYEPVLSSDAAGDQFFNFTDSFYPYRKSAASITAAQRQAILTDNYPRKRLVSQHQTRSDVILGGALWQRRNDAFSIIARARFGSRIEVGRGWYSDEFIGKGNTQIRDYTLNQQKNYLYELAVGYSREFTFINGLVPRISKLYIGIAPKIVLAGPGFNTSYEAQYRQSGNSETLFFNNFTYRATGEYARYITDYRANGDAMQAIDQNFNRKFTLNNTGYGLGFDFGLTYLIPLGSDISTVSDDPKESVVTKSLRIAFSVNDLGIVRNNKNPLLLSSSADTMDIAQEAPRESMFIGSDGQYLSYFDSANTLSNPFLEATTQESNAYSALLPTSVNGGIAIDFSRLKVMGDLTLGFNNTAFTTTKLAVHLGLEARPVPYVPVRIGTRLASGLPTHMGMGTGIETKYWDFNIGTQVILRSRTFTSEIVGAAFAGLQFHL